MAKIVFRVSGGQNGEYARKWKHAQVSTTWAVIREKSCQSKTAKTARQTYYTPHLPPALCPRPAAPASGQGRLLLLEADQLARGVLQHGSQNRVLHVLLDLRRVPLHSGRYITYFRGVYFAAQWARTGTPLQITLRGAVVGASLQVSFLGTRWSKP